MTLVSPILTACLIKSPSLAADSTGASHCTSQENTSPSISCLSTEGKEGKQEHWKCYDVPRNNICTSISVPAHNNNNNNNNYTFPVQRLGVYRDHSLIPK
jgi:hypothetical protein